MKLHKWCIAGAALMGIACVGDGIGIDSVNARTIQNFAGPFQTSRCAREARRVANQRAGNRSGHSRGLGSIAGGAIGGFTHGTSANRWQAVYNTAYRRCINR